MSIELPRVAILASGDVESGQGGSTAERVARDVLEGKVDFTIGVVVCNNRRETVGVYDKFDRLNEEFGLKGEDRIDVITINGRTHPGGKLERGQTLDESAAICRLLEERAIGFVTMLGYMKKATGEFADTWLWKPQHARHIRHGFQEGIYHPEARAMNNHPAILPFTADTYGQGAHQRALDVYKQGRLTHTAMTWQMAAGDVDAGPVIFAQPIEIMHDDTAETLGERVQNQAEKPLSAYVIERHLTLRAQHLLAT